MLVVWVDYLEGQPGKIRLELVFWNFQKGKTMLVQECPEIFRFKCLGYFRHDTKNTYYAKHIIVVSHHCWDYFPWKMFPLFKFFV